MAARLQPGHAAVTLLESHPPRAPRKDRLQHDNCRLPRPGRLLPDNDRHRCLLRNADQEAGGLFPGRPLVRQAAADVCGIRSRHRFQRSDQYRPDHVHRRDERHVERDVLAVRHSFLLDHRCLVPANASPDAGRLVRRAIRVPLAGCRLQHLRCLLLHDLWLDVLLGHRQDRRADDRNNGHHVRDRDGVAVRADPGDRRGGGRLWHRRWPGRRLLHRPDPGPVHHRTLGDADPDRAGSSEPERRPEPRRSQEWIGGDARPVARFVLRDHRIEHGRVFTLLPDRDRARQPDGHRRAASLHRHRRRIGQDGIRRTSRPGGRQFPETLLHTRLGADGTDRRNTVCRCARIDRTTRPDLGLCLDATAGAGLSRPDVGLPVGGVDEQCGCSDGRRSRADRPQPLCTVPQATGQRTRMPVGRPAHRDDRRRRICRLLAHHLRHARTTQTHLLVPTRLRRTVLDRDVLETSHHASGLDHRCLLPAVLLRHPLRWTSRL